MTSCICIGDPHFKVDNIIEVEIFINKLKKLIENIKPDFIVVLGDLLHTHERLHTVALNKAYEFIDMLRKVSYTYVIVGNHDLINHSSFLTENHWMNGMKEWKNVKIVDKVVYTEIKNNKFVMIPYVNPGFFEKSLNTLETHDWKKVDCIFAHQEFKGCKMGAIISVEGDEWNNEYPPVVSGHIHSRQILDNNIYYTGSAMQHAFGESENNIIAHLIFNENKYYQRNEIDLELTKKKIIYKKIKEFDSLDIVKKDNELLKLSLSGSNEEFKSLKKTKKYNDLIRDGIKIVFKIENLKKEEEIKNEDISTEKNEDIFFLKLLDEIITNENNENLYKDYIKIFK
jgi:DNA repair exonuclease SbcCD nuclease subunit